jgi:hypothetical protein
MLVTTAQMKGMRPRSPAAQVFSRPREALSVSNATLAIFAIPQPTLKPTWSQTLAVESNAKFTLFMKRRPALLDITATVASSRLYPAQ